MQSTLYFGVVSRKSVSQTGQTAGCGLTRPDALVTPSQLGDESRANVQVLCIFTPSVRLE